MPTSDTNLAEHSGSLVESHKGYDPRLISLYFVLASLLLTLVGGLAYQQLFRSETYADRGRVQSQRRVIVPGPRGNIYARDGVTLLVGNRPRFSVVLYLDELKSEFVRESAVIRKNYRKSDIKDITSSQLGQIARASVVQRYLDQVNRILIRDERVESHDLNRHFSERLLLPYHLLDDLSEHEYARLIERLPVRSPLQVYTSSARYYPNGSTAAHVLGYVGLKDEALAKQETAAKEEEDPDPLPGEDLGTFKMPSTIGKDGMEKSFDEKLQGESGGAIYRVDPAGYKVAPLEKRLPIQGKSIVTSLDLDLQHTAEQALGDQIGAAVAIEVKTGEVLAMTSKPDYDLSKMSPRFGHDTWADIIDRDALLNRAIGGAYLPGSTFKILVSIAALRAGIVTPDEVLVECTGSMRIGNTSKGCDNGHGHHGELALSQAIAVSCDIYYYTLGLKTTPEVIAAEARRFHMDRRTGIELPAETNRMLIPTPEWRKTKYDKRWFPGDTANMSIGQGDVLVTPLEMACFAASVARDEVYTKPTLIHDPEGKPQHTEPIGLTPPQRAALIQGMIDCTKPTYAASTAGLTLSKPLYKIPGVEIAGKTGTAQVEVYKDGKKNHTNLAWFICFAPAQNPEIAVAVMLDGQELNVGFAGGDNAAPVAATILKKYFEKKSRPAVTGAILAPKI